MHPSARLGVKNENPQIEIDPEIAKEAVKPIERMLELS